MRLAFMIVVLSIVSTVSGAEDWDFQPSEPRRVSLPGQGQVWEIFRRDGGMRIFLSDDLSSTLRDNRENLSRVNLSNLDLSEIDLAEANLDMAILDGTDVSGSDLSRGSFLGANLRRAILSSADLTNADLGGVDMRNATARDASLVQCDMSGADLRYCDLSGANFRGSYLYRVSLVGAKLAGAKFHDVEFLYVFFEPSELPDPGDLSGARGLRYLMVKSDYQPLETLRDEAYAVGLDSIGAELTCAIERSRNSEATRPGLTRILSYYLFDVTCAYGASPWRALSILAGISMVFYLTLVCRLRCAASGSSSFTVAYLGKSGRHQRIDVARILRANGIAIGERGRCRVFWWSCIAFVCVLAGCWSGTRHCETLTGVFLSRGIGVYPVGLMRICSILYSVMATFLIILWLAVTFGRPFG